MAGLPGAVPRMMRPAPGQSYPRTGFPLEGKARGARPRSAAGNARSPEGEVAVSREGWRRQHRGPLPFWVQVRAPDPGSSWDRPSSGCALVSLPIGPSFQGRRLWPFSAELTRSTGDPGKCQFPGNCRSSLCFRILFPLLRCALAFCVPRLRASYSGFKMFLFPLRIVFLSLLFRNTSVRAILISKNGEGDPLLPKRLSPALGSATNS